LGIGDRGTPVHHPPDGRRTNANAQCPAPRGVKLAVEQRVVKKLVPNIRST
jgi:hypothetical protein